MHRIAVGAAAAHIPAELIEELAAVGVMIIPIGPCGGDQQLQRVVKDRVTNKTHVYNLMGVRYVPLVHKPEAI